MEISVRYIVGEPAFDKLEVIKLVCDKSVDINSRVYGQAQLGRNDDSFFVRILSFEADPTAESCVWLNISANGKTLASKVNFEGSASLLVDGKAVEGKLTSYIVSGEDLQGEYWGAVMLLPLEMLSEHFGISEKDYPFVFSGNISRSGSGSVSSASLTDCASIVLTAKK